MYKDYAYRTVTAWLTNASSLTLKLVTPAAAFESGQWLDGKFPQEIVSIGPGKTVTFTVESARYLTGCEGTLVYEVSSSTWQNWLVHWNNPYCGFNTYRQVLHGRSLPATTHWDHENDDNWALPDFFHEVLADEAPQAINDDKTECDGW